MPTYLVTTNPGTTESWWLCSTQANIKDKAGLQPSTICSLNQTRRWKKCKHQDSPFRISSRVIDEVSDAKGCQISTRSSHNWGDRWRHHRRHRTVSMRRLQSTRSVSDHGVWACFVNASGCRCSIQHQAKGHTITDVYSTWILQPRFQTNGKVTCSACLTSLGLSRTSNPLMTCSLPLVLPVKIIYRCLFLS